VNEVREFDAAYAARAADQDDAIFVQESALAFETNSAWLRPLRNTACRRSMSGGGSSMSSRSECRQRIGISAEIRDKLFQPFFTTKPPGEGTGLGLSITWDIVMQQHGGSITVDSRVGECSDFALRLTRYP